jgi:capsular polysaccharide transport system ATP-binding protein
MIHLINLAKEYRTRSGQKIVLHAQSLSIPTDRRIGVLGRNGAGKTTLLNLIAGVEEPSQGRIVRTCSVSWPLGFSGGLHGDVTGRENTCFIARLNGADVDETIEFVREFSELGDDLNEPVRTYSQGMRARLAFSLSMAIDFDCYLIDEITAVGDGRFQAKCRRALRDRRDRSGLLMVSHNEATIRQYCDVGLVLYKGTLVPFDSIEYAVSFYRRSLAT